MALIIDERDFEKFILIADKVLIRPKTEQNKTKAGLYLPPGVQQKEKVFSGYVIKSGPGFPIPAMTDIDESWKNKEDDVKYLPLQAREGDLAVYLQNSGYDIEFKGQKYIIIPHSAILMLIRDESLFK